MWFQVIVIIGPPPAVAYPFILDIEGYPQQIINFFIVIVRLSTLMQVIPHISRCTQALFWLRWKKPNAARPFKGERISHFFLAR
jgi:L-type amino acid transporter 9